MGQGSFSSELQHTGCDYLTRRTEGRMNRLLNGSRVSQEGLAIEPFGGTKRWQTDYRPRTPYLAMALFIF
jgi:hypothetical protein